MTTLSPDLIAVLSGIGFDQNEALVYLSVLERGPSTVWEIAKQSGIKRPTCYVILDELEFRGYAGKTTDGKRAIYSVLSPRQLLQRVRTRQERFERALSELEGLASTAPSKPKIQLFEGVEGVKQAYLFTLDQPRGSELLLLGTSSVLETLADFIPDYIAARTKQKLTARAILADTRANRSVKDRDKKEARQTRFLQEDQFDPTLELNIVGDTVLYIAHADRQPFATVIESASIAALQRQTFELLWTQAKD